MSRLARARARTVFDSRGQPTVSVTLTLDTGARATVAAPSGASTGTHEVRALPEGGVPVALERFRTRVAPKLEAAPTVEIPVIDSLLHDLDPTPDFRDIGGNVATVVSVAASMLVAAEHSQELWQVWRASIGAPLDRPKEFPAAVGNCLNGGRHAVGGPDIQEFLAFSPDPDPMRAVEAAIAVHRQVGETLHHRYPNLALGRGDEGGWVAPVGNIEALEILADACAQVRDTHRVGVFPGLDLAASEFFRDGRYHYRDQTLDPEGQLGFVTKLVDRFGLRYLEDPFDQEDFASFASLTRAVGRRTLVVGDDLFTTSADRVERGVRERSANAVLVKVNQVGTVTDTFRTASVARSAGWTTVASHRSGDVPESWLAHLAIALGSAGIKCGLLGGERVAKLNELLRLAGRTEA